MIPKRAVCDDYVFNVIIYQFLKKSIFVLHAGKFDKYFAF
jgi:hypothetical protein